MRAEAKGFTANSKQYNQLFLSYLLSFELTLLEGFKAVESPIYSKYYFDMFLNCKLPILFLKNDRICCYFN